MDTSQLRYEKRRLERKQSKSRTRFSPHRKLRVVKYVFYKETLLDFREHCWTFAGAFAGISLIGLLHSGLFSPLDNIFLIGSFGATAVLVFGVIHSPLAQPRNLLGGHIISALIGVSIRMFLPVDIWLMAALAVSLSIVIMQITKTLHPPGGATSLIAVIGSEEISDLGYLYVFSPVLSGVVILFVIALVFNNATRHRRYPVNRDWYRPWFRRYSKARD